MYMEVHMRTLWIALLVVMSWSYQAGAAELVLAENGKSTYSIYREAKAPQSVLRAAAELRNYIEKATGAKLPIVTTPASPMICLGVNAASQAAGVDAGLPEFGFRLATKGQDIFIVGIDSLDGQEKWTGQIQQNTL